MGRVWFFDIQGWITLILGGPLAPITLFTSYSHVHLPFLGAVELTPGLMTLGLENLEPCVYTRATSGDVMTQSDSQGRDAVPHRRFHQAVRRWGNSLALRFPAACLRQAGLREGDQVEIVVGDDGRLSLEPLHQLDRSALAMDLRRLQATMPLTPSEMEECRAAQRW